MSTGVTVAILVAIAAVLIVAALLAYRRLREPEVLADPYVEALRLLVDGRKDEAFTALEKAVRGGTAPVDAYIRLGELLRERGEAGKALQIHRSLTVKSDLSRAERVELVVNIAEDYSVLGRPRQALDVLDTAVRQSHLHEALIYRILAREAHRLGNVEEAYEYLRELRKFDSIGERELALYLTTAGGTHARAGKLRDARRTFLRALRHDPDCAPALMALGNVEEAGGEEEEAIKRWQRAAVLSADLSRTALAKIERTMFQRGAFGEMERVYEQVLAARPDDEHAVTSLAMFYRKQGRVEDAISLVEDFRSNHGGGVESALLLTSLYAAARDTDTVEEFLDQNEGRFDHARQYRCNVCGNVVDGPQWHCPSCNSFDSYVVAGA